MTVFKTKDAPGLGTVRKDLVFSDMKVYCKNATTLGFGKMYAKRGYWIAANFGERAVFGRSLGRVDSDSAPWIENQIGLLMFASDGTFPIFRLVKPEEVMAIYEEFPARTLELMMADFSDPLAVLKRSYDGIPHGFTAYTYGKPLPMDPRFKPAVKEQA